MTYDEVIAMVRESPYSDEAWSHCYRRPDRLGVFTLKKNVNVYIIQHEGNDQAYEEKWATSHPDPRAYIVDYEIYYGAALVEQFFLVAVDGVRALLPQPDTNGMVPRHKYELARAVDVQGSVDEYIGKSQVAVGP